MHGKKHKTLALFICAMMVLSLCTACVEKPSKPDTQPTTETTEPEQTTPVAEPVEEIDPTEPRLNADGWMFAELDEPNFAPFSFEEIEVAPSEKETLLMRIMTTSFEDKTLDELHELAESDPFVSEHFELAVGRDETATLDETATNANIDTLHYIAGRLATKEIVNATAQNLYEDFFLRLSYESNGYIGPNAVRLYYQFDEEDDTLRPEIQASAYALFASIVGEEIANYAIYQKGSDENGNDLTHEFVSSGGEYKLTRLASETGVGHVTFSVSATVRQNGGSGTAYYGDMSESLYSEMPKQAVTGFGNTKVKDYNPADINSFMSQYYAKYLEGEENAGFTPQSIKLRIIEGDGGDVTKSFTVTDNGLSPTMFCFNNVMRTNADGELTYRQCEIGGCVGVIPIGEDGVSNEENMAAYQKLLVNCKAAVEYLYPDVNLVYIDEGQIKDEDLGKELSYEAGIPLTVGDQSIIAYTRIWCDISEELNAYVGMYEILFRLT